jgi:hypothetical protein
MGESVLLVEGIDDKSFFISLLTYMGIDNIRVEDIGGKNKYRESLNTLKKTGSFDNLEKLGIVLDADESYENTEQMICHGLRDHGFNAPSSSSILSIENDESTKSSYFVMPKRGQKGSLEDLFISCNSDHCIMPVVNDAIEEFKKLDNPPKNISKSKVQVLLASFKDTPNSLSIASRKRLWEYDSESLVEVKTYLRMLASD